MITVAGDAEPPSLIGVPSDITFDCNEFPAVNQASVQATDNCDSQVDVEFAEQRIANACANSYQLLRTWTATDDCGNMTSAEQRVNVGDFIPPVLSGTPVDETISCGGSPSPAPTLNATDNCDAAVQVEYLENSTSNLQDCQDEYIITRVWVATDACGNSSSTQQVITVQGDTEAPNISNVPDDVSTECGSVTEVPVGSVVVVDNCDTNVELVFEEVTESGACPQASRIIRTWSAVDACGNSSSESQIINLLDNTAPLIVGAPADITIDATDAIPSVPTLSVFDNCDANPEVEFSESIGGGCTYIITRTWEATDECGNASIAVQNITIQGNLLVDVISTNEFVCIGETIVFNANSNLNDTKYIWSVDGLIQADTTESFSYTFTQPGNFEILLSASAGGCESEILTNVLVQDAPSLSLSSNGPICQGDALELSVQGAEDYVWTGPDNFLSNMESPTVSEFDFPVGFYTFYVSGKINGGCVTVDSILVEVNNQNCTSDSLLCETPMVSVDIINTSCGNDDGSIVLSVERGKDVTYIWDPFVSTLDTSIVTDLAVGTYFVTVTSALNDTCSVVLPIIVGNINGPNPNILNQTAATCNEGGTIEFENNLGYQFEWSDGFVGAFREGLLPDNYLITVTDPVTECANVLTIIIEDGCNIVQVCEEPVISNVDIGNAICNGETGSVSINLSEPDTNFIFTWMPNLGIQDSVLSSTWINIPVGNYTVQVARIEDLSCYTNVEINIAKDSLVAEIETIIDTDCNEANGLVEFVDTTLNYQWSDNQLGHTRVDLSAGTYTVIVSSQQGCTLIVEDIIVAENCGAPNTGEVDTVWISTPELTPVEVCLDIKHLDLLNLSVTSWCGPGAGIYTMEENCIIYTPDSTLVVADTDELCITLCDDQGECINYVVIINIIPECSGELIVFSDDAVVLDLDDCSGQAEYCLDIDINEADRYTFTNNDGLFDMFSTCNYDSVYNFTYFSIPDLGASGPYTINSFMINDDIFSGDFNSLDDLLALLNEWDELGNWELDSLQLLISGGVSANTYGVLEIEQDQTGQIAMIDINAVFLPSAISLVLDEGEYNIVSTNMLTGCKDTVHIMVNCIPASILNTTTDTINIVMEVNTDTLYCIDTDEFTGPISFIDNYCEEETTGNVEYTLLDSCLLIESFEVGEDQACIIACDAAGVCDSTVVFVDIVAPGAIITPVAMDDDTITLVNFDLNNIDILENDTFGTEIISINILTDPQYGQLELNSDNTINYYPNPDFCGEIDSFNYQIITKYGIAEATVYVDILCEDLTIYNGFSPNGDGINETFTISGIELYPDNLIHIYNRWGALVYLKHGYTNDYGWDGTWEGKHLPDGTYFYVADIGNGEKFSGYVQIHR
jgi:gliding motility-associated-like protein